MRQMSLELGTYDAEHLVYHNISLKRREDCLRVLTGVETFLGHELVKISAAEFHSWMTWRKDEGDHINTIRKKGNYIRSFVRWAWEQHGWIDSERASRIKLVKNPRGASGKTKPNPYDYTQIGKLYEWVDEKWPTCGDRMLANWHAGYGTGSNTGAVLAHMQNAQVKAIIACALDGGMRRKEILAAAIGDISPFNEMMIVWHGKAGPDGVERYREVPMSEEARAALLRWWTLRGPFLLSLADIHNVDIDPGHQSPWVVLDGRGVRLGGGPVGSPMTMNILESLLTPWSLHRLRHTIATWWLRSGEPLHVVSRKLGHSNLEQTLCYAELNSEDLKASSDAHADALRRLMPRRT